MESTERCPACYQPEALIALGVRHDRPHRWRLWMTTVTRLYLCQCCGAVVTLGEGDRLVVNGTPDEQPVRADADWHGRPLTVYTSHPAGTVVSVR